MGVLSGAKHETPREAQRPRGDAALTIIAAGTRIVGEIQSEGVVKIEGTIVGTVHADQQVLVARGGVIEGDVVTREAVFGGAVRGSVIASGRVEVQQSCVVTGDITTERLVVHEGGEVNGTVAMGKRDDLSPDIPRPEFMGDSMTG